MKVLFIFHDSDLYSGGTKSMIEVVQGIAESSQIECVALFPDDNGSGKEYVESIGIKTFSYRYAQIKYLLDEGILRHIARFPYRLRDLLMTICNTIKFNKIIKKEKIDVIYTNTSVIINGVILKLLNKNLRHIWHIREFCEEDHRIGIFFGRKLYYNLLNNNTDDVIFISKSLAEKYRYKINKPTLYRLYDDVSSEYFCNKPDFVKGQELNILIAGMICEGKGQLDVVKAVGELVKVGISVKLYIAGRETSPVYVNLIKQYIEDNKLCDNVIFLGLVKNISEVRKMVDIGVVASKSEAFGRVTIEGMLSGLLMIGADTGGTKELIDNNVTGLLYEHANYKKLAETIHYIYNNPELFNVIRKNGQKYSTNFVQGKCVCGVIDILNGGQSNRI